MAKQGIPVILYSVKDKKGLRKAKELNLNFIFDSENVPLDEI